MVQTLTETIKEFDHVLLFDELPGEAVLSKVAFQNFLCERSKVHRCKRDWLDAKLV